tara:strand:+ start:470 stop:661 length:192 start_codon:yes stop_codon:yes gene_type:complete
MNKELRFAIATGMLSALCLCVSYEMGRSSKKDEIWNRAVEVYEPLWQESPYTRTEIDYIINGK